MTVGCGVNACLQNVICIIYFQKSRTISLGKYYIGSDQQELAADFLS